MRYLAILFFITFFGNTVYGFKCSTLKNEFASTIEYLSIAMMYQGYMFGKNDVKIKSDKELIKK